MEIVWFLAGLVTGVGVLVLFRKFFSNQRIVGAFRTKLSDSGETYVGIELFQEWAAIEHSKYAIFRIDTADLDSQD